MINIMFDGVKVLESQDGGKNEYGSQYN